MQEKTTEALQRLQEENKLLRSAYWKMRNAAAGYSNFCDENASTRRCDRDYEDAEDLFRSIGVEQ